jgi:hypothetical protein
MGMTEPTEGNEENEEGEWDVDSTSDHKRLIGGKAIWTWDLAKCPILRGLGWLL